MFYQFFFSPQVKRCVIISNTHGIYEKRQELPKTSDFESWEFLKILANAQCSPQMENLAKILNPPRSALSHIKEISRQTTHPGLYPEKVASNLRQTPSNPICFTVFVTLRPLTQL